VLTGDPLASVEIYARKLESDAGALRIRLHDSLLSAEKIISLGSHAFDTVLPLLPSWPQKRTYPATPLRFSQAKDAAILVVDNDPAERTAEMMALLTQEFPSERFVAFESSVAFERAWKMVLHLGLVSNIGLGARLSDAWAGGVPVLQLVDPQRLDAYRRRQNQASGAFVEHGKTGLMFPTREELVRALRELFTDSLPARAVARAARYRVDPAVEWDALLSELLL
jgi:hypothetical protein